MAEEFDHRPFTDFSYRRTLRIHRSTLDSSHKAHNSVQYLGEPSWIYSCTDTYLVERGAIPIFQNFLTEKFPTYRIFGKLLTWYKSKIGKTSKLRCSSWNLSREVPWRHWCRSAYFLDIGMKQKVCDMKPSINVSHRLVIEPSKHSSYEDNACMFTSWRLEQKQSRRLLLRWLEGARSASLAPRLLSPARPPPPPQHLASSSVAAAAKGRSSKRLSSSSFPPLSLLCTISQP